MGEGFDPHSGSQTFQRLLELANRHVELRALIREFVSTVGTLTGFEAVAVRLLDEHGSIPYHAHQGFRKEFLQQEDRLSIQSDRCLCVNIINGEIHSGHPCFTAAGSFYSNNTTDFRASIPEEQKHQFRFTCNDYGYESLALIPICQNGSVLGLIQLADSRADKVPLKLVQEFETIAYPLGVAIQRVRSRERLGRSERDLALKNRLSGIFLLEPEENIRKELIKVLLDAADSPSGFIGCLTNSGEMVFSFATAEASAGNRFPDKVVVLPRERWEGIWTRVLCDGQFVHSNLPLVAPDGRTILSRVMAVPIAHLGKIVGLVAVADGATEYDHKQRRLLELVSGHVGPILYERLQREKRRRVPREAGTWQKDSELHPAADGTFAGMVGRNPKMLEVFKSVVELASVDAPVLVQGESGTGKELVATAIHNLGPRAENLFVPVNCSALPETLLESELFGHVRGAFSGAIRDKKGRFELADGGTLFLDEIGDMSPVIQVRLLRVLQEGTFEPVGGEETRKVNVRVISATHKNLHREVAAGRFREDLFYRLCVIPISLPPLRERRDDIPLLAFHILRQQSTRLGRKEPVLSPEALDTLTNYSWPGNVRELQNALHYALVKCRGEVVEPQHFPPIVFSAAVHRPHSGKKGRKPKLDAGMVQRALNETCGNRAAAARQLHVARATVYRFLARGGESNP